MNSASRIPKFLKTPALVSSLLTALMALSTLIFFFRIQPQVPIFYSLARPSEHLVSKNWLFLFPILSLVFNLLHLMIVGVIKSIDKLLLKLFAWTAVGVQIILGIALLRIIIIIS